MATQKRFSKRGIIQQPRVRCDPAITLSAHSLPGKSQEENTVLGYSLITVDDTLV